MSTAVASYLELHRDWVDISVDDSSAFNSFDRETRLHRVAYAIFRALQPPAGSQMEGLHASCFMGMALALLRFLTKLEHARTALGKVSCIASLFTHFSYSLTRSSGGEVKVLAFADDFHFLGPPKLAAAAVAR